MSGNYQNPIAEQRLLLAGKAVCWLPERAVLRVTGVDRLTWLHALLSQNLAGLGPRESAEALLLDPQGRIEQDIHLVADEEGVWLWVGAQRGAALLAHLRRMVFRAKVEIEDLSGEFAVAASFGASLADSGEVAGSVAVWRDPWPGVAPGGWRYGKRALPTNQWQAYESLVSAPATATATATQAAPAATAAPPTLPPTLATASLYAYEALRVFAGRPSEAELDERSLPHELDLLATAVHMSKGCYRGQESVAKVHNLGHPPRRLTLLHLDGSGHELPVAGAEVRVAGEEAARGVITSVGQHYEAGPIALAMLSRNTPVDATLAVAMPAGGSPIAANQEVLVPPEAGKPADLGAGRSLLRGGGGRP